MYAIRIVDLFKIPHLFVPSSKGTCMFEILPDHSISNRFGKMNNTKENYLYSCGCYFLNSE